MRGRCRAIAALVGIAALIVSCASSTETSSAPTSSATSTAAPDRAPSVLTPLLATAVAAPIPAPATDGKVHLAYKLQLTNAFNQELTLTSVHVRNRLSSGQVIALLGSSGNSDGPHLHFHVMSTPDRLRSDGLPFVLSSFTLDGCITSMDAEDAIEAGQPAPMQPGFTARDESGVSPLVLDVMTYAGR